MAEYLDYTGLTYFKNKLDQSYNSKYVPQGVTINGVALNSSNITINAVDSTARIASSEKGVANGVATLDSNAKIPSSQLPSYVDDVKEYSSTSNFPSTGETDKIYVATDTGSIYRWSGTQYIQINSSVANAESAIKDGSGNTITTTYATKTELSTAVPASVGSATKPVYTNSSGVVTECTYSLNKDVPADALFTDHTYSNFVKSGTGAAAGLVPAPSTTEDDKKFLCEDATWKVPYTHPTTAGNKHIPSGGSTGQVLIYGGSSGVASWSDVSSAITSITTTQIDALFA